jgi:hypothetical protein
MHGILRQHDDVNHVRLSVRDQLILHLNEDVGENEIEDMIPSESIINVPQPFFPGITSNGQKTNFKPRLGSRIMFWMFN